mmetsp:Transcript_16182/g.23600  ORF Transcript_16182/g.23600 Transcript_16182/m.23600 type:complete len:369 (-) Transcript_16182:35-1141(-)
MMKLLELLSFIFAILFSQSFSFRKIVSPSQCSLVLYEGKDVLEGLTPISTDDIKTRIVGSLLGSLFRIQPVFKLAASKARTMMVDRGLQIDVDWKRNVDELNSNIENLNIIFEKFNSKLLQYPSYYLKPFHAYDEGNLSWQAAMEVDSAALTVHAQVYTTGSELDRNGDFTLRENFHNNIRKIFEKFQFKPTKILDIGCSTGLSSFKFLETFPGAEIIGLDLSPYMLSVAQFKLNTNQKLLQSLKAPVSFIHAAGEDTSMGPGDVDLVSISLVSHELPASASAAIFQEAYRILPSGGAIAIMDMDPDSTNFKKFSSNPFAFTAFKSTEPWIQEYVSMDMYSSLRNCGFSKVQMLSNSPRHRTVVGFKL